MKETKKRILSGITPSGNALHIGNYFGAVKPQIELQNTHQTYYFVADLHALTTIHDREELERKSVFFSANLPCRLIVN